MKENKTAIFHHVLTNKHLLFAERMVLYYKRYMPDTREENGCENCNM